MKYLILFLISFNLWANYIPESKVGQDTTGISIYLKKQKCEAQYGEPCIKFSSNTSYKKIDPAKFLKEQVEVCLDADDCQAKHAAKVCLSEGFYPIKNLDLMESYCTKYEPKKIIDDATLKAQYESNMETAATQKKNERDAMILIRDKAGDLTSAEIKSALQFILKKGL